jgi:BirA family biotin operon repressor/biotin-[acetyl-CoA-carboxylase] ligase
VTGPTLDDPQLAARLGVPQVLAYDVVESTQDVAHRAAQGGAPAGTVVVANAQSAGRGRQGRYWHSAPGSGLWFTLIERPPASDAIELLALRAGLAIAPALDELAEEVVRLKWPNDLYLQRGKLGGILSEARWRENRLEWVAIGVGINLLQPPVVGSAALVPGPSPAEVLLAVVPPLRAAVARQGVLDQGEMAHFAARDWAAGRRALAPEAGMVLGITPEGELRVRGGDGVERRCRSGSLLLEGDA